MAQVNIRDIDDNIYRRYKAEAALAGKTLGEYFAWALQKAWGEEEGPPAPVEVRGEYRAQGTIGGGERKLVDPETGEEVRGSDAKPNLPIIPKGTANPELNVLDPRVQKVLEQRAGLAEKAREQLEKLAAAPVGKAHDGKTCRVYRCGICLAIGVKDKARGLV